MGGTATGKVSKIAEFGVFIELEGGVEGLIHVSEMNLEPQVRLEDKFEPGQEITAKIVKVDCEERKIALSVSEYVRESEQAQLEEFHASQGSVDQSLERAVQEKADVEGQEEQTGQENA